MDDQTAGDRIAHVVICIVLAALLACAIWCPDPTKHEPRQGVTNARPDGD